MKSVRIQSFSGPYSVQMCEKTDQKNPEYGHFSRSLYETAYILIKLQTSVITDTVIITNVFFKSFVYQGDSSF